MAKICQFERHSFSQILKHSSLRSNARKTIQFLTIVTQYAILTNILYTAQFQFCFWCMVRQFNNFDEHWSKYPSRRRLKATFEFPFLLLPFGIAVTILVYMDIHRSRWSRRSQSAFFLTHNTLLTSVSRCLSEENIQYVC